MPVPLDVGAPTFHPWSASASSGLEQEEGPSIGLGRRYEPGGLLGRGGMGEVRVARDTWLGRDIAIKRARAHDADAARRLAREAMLTAELEHPNIVPVYEAGRDEEGQPFYTMRLLPGRSLADELASVEGDARLRLVRHVLGATEAITYAHDRGILHRDLKPANIMVGGLGETVVADWGLACRTSEKSPSTAGTPGYMSPEQARGEAVDGRTDVYGLGAILYALLVGASPPQAPVPAVRTVAPDVPAELAAIADRALQPDRAARYPSARALADDLLAWFEGRQVAAHSYSPSELVRRVFLAYRLPIVVGSLAAVLLSMAVGVGWWRTSVERRRAVGSEQEAQAARQSEQRALAGALVAQGKSAADTNRIMEGEVFAANALVREESPEARGLLARLHGPRMSLLRASPLPACRMRAFTVDGSRMACSDERGVRVFDPLRPDVILGEAAGRFVFFDFVNNDHLLLNDDESRLHAWSPPNAPVPFELPQVRDMRVGTSRHPDRASYTAQGMDVVVDVRSHTAYIGHACGSQPATPTAVAEDGSLFSGFPDNRIVRGPPGAFGAETVFRVNLADGVVNRIRELPDGRLVIGTYTGVALLFSPEGVEQGRVQVGGEAIREILPFDDRVALRSLDGNVVIWSLDGAVAPTRLYSAAAIVWPGDATVLRFMGDSLEDRRIPKLPPVHRVTVGSGLTSVTWAPDAAHVAVGAGDGRVVVIDVTTGKLSATYKWVEGVVKDVAWSPDGERIVAAIAGNDQRIVSFPSGETEALSTEKWRRVAWLPSGNVIGAPYEGRLYIYGPDPAVDQRLGLPEMKVVGGVGAGTGAEDVIWRIQDGHPPTFRALGTHVGIQAVTPLGDETVLVSATEMLWLDAQGATIKRVDIPYTYDIASSPDRRWLALGHMDGSVSVWPAHGDAVAARLRGHTARVAGISFSPDSTKLATAAWDGDVRLWSLADLESPAEAVRARIEAEWGRTLADVLARQGPPPSMP